MASSATRHFVLQRFTAAIQVPLVIWLVISLVRHAGDTRAEFIAWAGQVVNTGLLSAFVLSVGFHMYLGMGEVIDDYIHKTGSRSLLSGLNAGVALIATIVAFFSIIAIALIV